MAEPELVVVFREQIQRICPAAASVARQIRAAIEAGAGADDVIPLQGMCLAELCTVLNLCSNTEVWLPGKNKNL
jgi:hypothetical protein